MSSLRIDKPCRLLILWITNESGKNVKQSDVGTSNVERSRLMFSLLSVFSVFTHWQRVEFKRRRSGGNREIATHPLACLTSTFRKPSAHENNRDGRGFSMRCQPGPLTWRDSVLHGELNNELYTKQKQRVWSVPPLWSPGRQAILVPWMCVCVLVGVDVCWGVC